MARTPPYPVVHLELHTGDLSAASAFYSRLLGWSPRRLAAEDGSYLALKRGVGLGGGIVECRPQHPLWLPYVEVAAVAEVTERARQLGATVALGPREGPAGWRSVITGPAGGELAFWQGKR